MPDLGRRRHSNFTSVSSLLTAGMESCTIITTEANELIREYHDRMQVILEPQECELWLDAKVEDPKLLEPLLQPFSGKEMLVCSVQTIVNNPKNGVPECIVLA